MTINDKLILGHGTLHWQARSSSGGLLLVVIFILLLAILALRLLTSQVSLNLPHLLGFLRVYSIVRGEREDSVY